MSTVTGTEASSTAAAVTSSARRGAAWSLLISVMAAPLPFLRTWLLARFDSTGLVLGRFALILLLLNAINTFLFPGGRNVFPAFFPKMADDRRRSRFVSGYFYVVVAAALAGVGLVMLWPGLLDLQLHQRVGERTRWLLMVMIPVVLTATHFTSALLAHMSFALASILQNTQVFCVCATAAVLYLVRPEWVVANTELWLGGAIVLAHGVNIAVAGVALYRRMPMDPRPEFPAGVSRFALYAYLDTVTVYAYTAIDQFYVQSHCGTEQLGVYFALLQVARIIPLAVQHLGHLMLTTFSRLLGSGEERALASSYHRVTRLTVGLYTLLSLALVFLSRPLAYIFRPEFAERHVQLLCLAVIMNIESIRTVNAMILMAYERMSTVFFSKALQIVVQWSLTIWWMPRWGVYGAIWAKGMGHVVSAAVLYVSVGRLHGDRRFTPSSTFFLSQLLVVAAGFFAYRLDGLHAGYSVLGLLVACGLFWAGGGIGGDDLRALVPRRWSRRADGP